MIKIFKTLFFTVLLFLVVSFSVLGQSEKSDFAEAYKVKNDRFVLQFTSQGISSLQKTADIYPTDYVQKDKVFGQLLLRYSYADGSLDSLKTSLQKRFLTVLKKGEENQVRYAVNNDTSGIKLVETYTLTEEALTWDINLKNSTNRPISVEDMIVPFFYNNQGGENSEEIFEEQVIKHHFISGDNSFIFWQRPSGLGPYLVMTPLEDTSLEYFSTSAVGIQPGAFQVFIHSAALRNKDSKEDWRLPHTAATINKDEELNYGFKFRWAEDYSQVRDILVEEGLIDVQVIPGMTISNDMSIQVALRTKQEILELKPEYPSETKIVYKGKNNKGTFLYDIHFDRLGENKVTIHYGEDLETILEFFVTEPLETLYKKRASFIVNTQQHRDSTKWYNGLFGIWDMKTEELRGPENADGFDKSRLVYVLASDDPILGKASYVAAKNLFYPNKKEISALEYHIQHFVWGGLQRTDEEIPNPYGIYGTPNWKVNRNQKKRSENLKDPNRNKMHIWRSYDYPHIMMLYYHMYEIAKLYPDMTTYLDKEGYLQRATETAKAYFTYPYDILPWYETYKWGCYNELLIVDLITELEKTGHQKDADWLRAEWEKKVKYFIYDDPYPFRSEYAVDATAYESTHALAKYALNNTMKPDTNLWYDKNLKKWYSHPEIKPADADKFMDKQINANIASRGWLESAYYYLGSDFRGNSDKYTLSYMSQMGGWAILDYALNFSKQPANYIRLGYASYLSSFALINSGTKETNYGYWYPGKANDGAAGWAFEPQKQVTSWIGKSQQRGPWYYDGEIDLGFGGATRMAATIITKDPIFGLVAYGGVLLEKENLLKVIPKDGLRRRFFYRNGNLEIDLQLNRDGFAKEKPVSFELSGNLIKFSIENRTADIHDAVLDIKGMEGSYVIWVAGKRLSKQVFRSQTLSSLKIPINKIDTTEVILTKI